MIICITVSCNNKNLSKETAHVLIVKKYNYPTAIDYDIFCSDPVHATNVIRAGLEDKGLVTVKRTLKLRDVGKPLIEFTSRAKSFLMETSVNDRSYYIQKIKIGTENFDKITKMDFSKSMNVMIVEYITIRQYNVFGKLLKKEANEEKTNIDYFYFAQDGWEIVKRKDAESGRFSK